MDNLFASVKSIHMSNTNQIHFIAQYTCDCIVRIEVLVLLASLLLVVHYILDMFRRRSHNHFLLFLLTMLATLPYALLDYTLALMQLAKSNNDTYQVWAVVLVTLKYSIRAVQPTRIFAKQNPLRDMMSSLWTANLLGMSTSLLKIPLWLLWSLNSVRIILGFADTELTSSRHRRHLRLLTEYMRTEHKHPPLKDCDARKMKGYKYLVWGEDKQKVRSDPPEYRIKLEVTKEKQFITTNKVWERDGALLGELKESNELKDLCLAFALFKLLRRRFFGLPIHEANQPKTKELVLKGLIANQNHDRAFKIVAMELAFVDDFFFTRYGVMFARGLPKRRLLLSLSVIGVASYLGFIFYHSRDRLAGDLSKTAGGISVTWMLLVILTMKEIWEMVTYVLSDWTKVVLVSNYVQHPWWTRYSVIVAVVKCLCKYKIAKRWHGNLQQHNLLQSFQYLQCFAIVKAITLHCRVHLRLPGYKGSPQITLPMEVKRAISESLQYLCNQPEDLKKYLSTAANSLCPEFGQKLSFTSEFATETQRILVWHIATSYCEIYFATTAQHNPTLSRLNTPFLLENLGILGKGLESHYKAATALSQYSAHLLTLQSPLVPDHSLVATELFKSTRVENRQFLHRCRSWKDVLRKLNDCLAGKKDDDDNHSGDISSPKKRMRCLIFRLIEERKRRARSRSIKGKKILKIGVELGKTLVQEIKTQIELWKFLEKFWAGYLLHLAASVSPDRHLKSLYRDGEFLTHVWALLSHAGILLRKTDLDKLLAVCDVINDTEVN